VPELSTGFATHLKISHGMFAMFHNIKLMSLVWPFALLKMNGFG